MTTPPPTPPPPPSSAPQWPSSGGGDALSTRGAGDGRAPWWSTGRVIAAIALVVVLMGGAASVGFLAGLAVNAGEVFVDGGAGSITFDGDFDAGMEDLFEDELNGDIPGVFGLGSEVDDGPPLTVGARAAGQVGDLPVEHLLTTGGGPIVIEIIEADFDTVLVLLEQDGTVITTDDDGGEAPLSRIAVDVPEGTYLVRVQPWGGGGGGYTVSVD